MWGTQPGRGPRLSSASRPCSVPQPAPPAPCRAQRGCRPASGRPAGGPHSPVPEPPRPPSAAAGAEGAPGDPWPGRQQGARDPVLGAGASGLETRSTEKTPGGEARGLGVWGALLPLPPLAGDGGVWEEWAAAPGGSTARPGLQRQPCASRPSLSGSSVATSGRDAGP